MDEILMKRLLLMTSTYNPLLLEELVELTLRTCDYCERIPRNRKLIQCVFCVKKFCLSCSGKENTRICSECNYAIATSINKTVLKQFSVKELRVLTDNYNVPLQYINEKDEMIDAILISFQKSIENPSEVVNVSELKQKMKNLEIEENEDKLKRQDEEKIQSKIFSDYSNVRSENKQLSICFHIDDSIDISEEEIPKLSIEKIKQLLNRFKVDYHGILEKKELVSLAINLHQAFTKFKKRKNMPESKIPIANELECKICMDALISCVFFDCGHSTCCYNCGINMALCPLCRKEIQSCLKIVIG